MFPPYSASAQNCHTDFLRNCLLPTSQNDVIGFWEHPAGSSAIILLGELLKVGVLISSHSSLYLEGVPLP